VLEYSWKPFYESLFSCSFAIAVSVKSQKKRRLFNANFSRKKTDKNQSEAGLESTEDTPFLKSPRATPTGVLEHCREEETNSYFSIFETFTSDCFTKATIYLFIHNFTFSDKIIMGNTLAATPPQKKLNYTSGFLEYFEATTNTETTENLNIK